MGEPSGSLELFFSPLFMKDITITEEEFDKRFPLIKNHIADNASLDGCMFETYGKELEHVMRTRGEYVWTYADVEDGMAFLSGYHLVNRIGYIISSKPVPKGECYHVLLEESPAQAVAERGAAVHEEIRQDLQDEREDQDFSKEGKQGDNTPPLVNEPTKVISGCTYQGLDDSEIQRNALIVLHRILTESELKELRENYTVHSGEDQDFNIEQTITDCGFPAHFLSNL